MKFIVLLVSLVFSTSCSSSPKNITLTPQNSAILRLAVNKTTVNLVIQKLMKLDKSLPADEPIYLILDTPGGSIVDGNDLVEYIKGLKREVKTIAIRAMSMGFMIQQAAGERLVLASSILMSHPAATSCQGSTYELKVCLDIVIALEKHLNAIAAKRMHMNIDDYIKLIEHSKFFIGTDMMFFNAADRIVTIKCSEELMKEKYSIETELFFGFKSKEEFNACPFL